jgi:hypothetical protein
MPLGKDNAILLVHPGAGLRFLQTVYGNYLRLGQCRGSSMDQRNGPLTCQV